MQTARLLTLLAVTLLMAASPAMAAWIGNVPDVTFSDGITPVPSLTVLRLSDQVTFSGMANPIQAAIDDAATLASETLLIGPGLYSLGPVSPSEPRSVNLAKQVKLIGSGSAADSASNTIISGAGFQTEGIALRVGGVSATDRVTLANLRVTDTWNHSTIFRNVDDSLVSNKFFLYDNVAMYNIAQSGYGSGIDINTGTGGIVEDVIIRNSLFYNSTYVGIRGASTSVARNWQIVGNEFDTMNVGTMWAGEEATNILIKDNMFKNMWASVSYNNGPDGIKGTADDFETASNGAGVTIGPRKRNLGPTGINSQGQTFLNGVAKDILIVGNIFQDNGFNGVYPGGAPTQINNSVGGVGFTSGIGDDAQAMIIESVLMRGNTFKDTAAGLPMARGIRLSNSDNNGPIAGIIRYVSEDGNTYVGTTEDILGVARTATTPNIGFNPINLTGGINGAITLVNDTTGDNKITVADINGNLADVNGDLVVDSADKVALVTRVLCTSVADTDLSMKVDIVDLGNLANLYDLAGQFQDGDTDFNGLIDIVDLGNMANDYDKTYALSPAVAGYIAAGASVPEPATLGLLTLGAIALLRRRRK